MTRSSDQNQSSRDSKSRSPLSWFSAVLYPNLYLWLIFVAALDVILTRVILFFGGTEVNPVADWILDEFGRIGMSVFKFIIVTIVIVCCEIVGRQKYRTGRNLAFTAILISCLPVIWSSMIIFSLIMDPPTGQELIEYTMLLLQELFHLEGP